MRLRPALAGALLLLSCSAPNPSLRVPAQVGAQAQASLMARFSASPDLPATQLALLTGQAQAYADEISKRREIDFFRLHPRPVGLRLGFGTATSWLLSYLGTSRERQDLNLELRVVGSDSPGMNLNYSGPVTLGRTSARPDVRAGGASDWRFELITGLPGEGVIEAYEAYAEGLAQYLRSRYQARPFSFDDGPLVYAIHVGGQLQGFAFFNQGNRLILGERKYADVQSVAVISSQRKLLGAYTLIGFNPKTAGPDQEPAYQVETDSRFGELVQFGEL